MHPASLPLPLDLPTPTWVKQTRGREPGGRRVWSSAYALVRTSHLQAVIDALAADFAPWWDPRSQHPILVACWKGEGISAVGVFDQEPDMAGYGALRALAEEGWCRLAYSRLPAQREAFLIHAPAELQAVIGHQAVLQAGKRSADPIAGLVPEPRG